MMYVSPIRQDLASSSSAARKSKETRYVKAQKNAETIELETPKNVYKFLKNYKKQVQSKIFILALKRGKTLGKG